MNTHTTNYDKILQDVKEIKNNLYKFNNKKAFNEMTFKEFEKEMINEYNELYTSFNFIFNKAISGELDISMFSFMINKAKSIQKKNITKFDASKDVGTKLVDTYIKPKINKDKDNSDS